MRKLLFVLLFITVLCVAGCSSDEPLLTDTDTVSGNLILITEPSEAESVSSEKPTEQSATETTTTITPPKETENTSPEQTASGTKEEQTEDKTSIVTEPTQPQPEESNPPKPETPPAFPYATSADAKEISALVAAYINGYRTEQGTASATVLPRLTEYAERRSVQIISDFSHNTFDERAAATAMAYGKYIDPSLYGMNGEPYYTACAGEAIAKAGYIGTVDHVARSLAKLIRNSPEHWCYIGAADYQYIGVGITYKSGMWYCDVALTRESFG